MAPAPLSPLRPAEPVSGQPVPGGRQLRGAAAAGPAAEIPTAAPPRAAAGNPSLRLDPGLGLVVIEFHNAAGTVTGTIPTAQQLQAYRRWETAQMGPSSHAAPAADVGGDTVPPAVRSAPRNAPPAAGPGSPAARPPPADLQMRPR
jgi:hypothetical protein